MMNIIILGIGHLGIDAWTIIRGTFGNGMHQMIWLFLNENISGLYADMVKQYTLSDKYNNGSESIKSWFSFSMPFNLASERL